MISRAIIVMFSRAIIVMFSRAISVMIRHMRALACARELSPE